MTNLFDLTGKGALVTGARTGLGHAIALTLAEAGADIIGLGSSPMPDTEAAVRALGRRFVAVEQDLTQPADFAGLIARLEREAFPIDILVNNAGNVRRANLLEFSEADWDAVTAVHQKSLFFLSQAAARPMVARGFGRIINIASLLSFQGGIRVPAYTAAKHAVAGITKAMANELAPLGVTVNAIAPGYMETDNTAALRADPQRQRQILERIPLGRWGAPEDLATAVLFLAAPASGYVTGTIIPVDGGWLAR